MSVERIIESVKRFPTRFAVVTGGEPMIAPDVTELTRLLHDHGFHVTIETAATVYRDVTCDLASLSPKLANSTPDQRDAGAWADRHDRGRLNLQVIQRFMDSFPYQLKFVVDAPDDLQEIDTIVNQLNNVPPENVLLMPQGRTAAELDQRSLWVTEVCRRRGFRFCPRMHIALFGNVRGR